MNDDLASGFRDVDNATDFGLFSRCLTLVESLPFFSECKRESYALLDAAPGRRILDVGCGLGGDAAALAKLVAPGRAVVGVDGSRAMIEAARGRCGGVEGLTFEVADAADLPFDDATFDACRVDCVLQHIADPVPAVREMARVLCPGGKLVAYDNDWETLTVDAADRALTRTVLNAWCDRFPSGWIGRRLVPLFLQAGLGDVVAYPRTLVLRDLACCRYWQPSLCGGRPTQCRWRSVAGGRHRVAGIARSRRQSRAITSMTLPGCLSVVS